MKTSSVCFKFHHNVPANRSNIITEIGYYQMMFWSFY